MSAFGGRAALLEVKSVNEWLDDACGLLVPARDRASPSSGAGSGTRPPPDRVDNRRTPACLACVALGAARSVRPLGEPRPRAGTRVTRCGRPPASPPPLVSQSP